MQEMIQTHGLYTVIFLKNTPFDNDKWWHGDESGG